ncbi:hypothetical protein, partial [Endozoicomonas sp. SESOKO1]|uniref:hypothetical protein n=1 Tax=Endozoicomonas sp. SESOKO1 TaxID=2828742 RepID=UPI002148B4CA
VSPDAVVRDYQAARATQELARFTEQCCLKGLSLNGQLVTPDMVIKGFPASPEGKLAVARFKADCCLRGLALNDLLLTPDEVVRDYQSARAPLELARFKAECCLRGVPLNGGKVTPDTVVKDYQAARAPLELARFKEQCCLRSLPLNGQPVTPDAVVKDYQSARAVLELARFKAECCLRGLPLNDQQITTEVVVRDYQAIKATLELARFKAECCLRGLPLHGRQVTQDSVVRDYQIAKATLEQARFRAECCLRGLALNSHLVTPDSVVKSFPDSPEGKLGIALFKTKCCLRGLTLNGQLVTPDVVVKSFPDSPEGKLGTALFKSKCCLRGLTLDGQLVTPETVVKGYPDSPEGKLGVLRFKAECCLKGRQLHGHLVTPESVVEGYKRGGWLLENAIFCTQLALNGRELNGNYLDNQDVLEAFNEVPGDHTARQAEYLIQKLQQPQRYDETSEAQDIIQKAWQILNSVSLKDEHPRLRCVVQFLAMRNELTIDHQGVSAEQVLCSIKLLRQSFLNSRIHFFFLAHCYITSLPVHGRPINKNQVLRCLQNFPEGSKLHHALGCWFEQRSCEANLMDELLFKRQNPVRHDHRYPLPDVIPDTENSGQRTAWAESASTAQPLKQESETGSQGFPDNQVSRVNGLTLKTLGIIQEINGSYRNPPILITGSYARFLQNLCSSFNDIDIICTTEDSARTLFKKLQGLNSDGDAEIPRNIIIWPVPGSQAIKLPNAFNIQLKDGDLGTKAMALQVSVDHRVTHGNAGPLAADVPGVAGPVWCLSFDEETRLLNDTLEYLATNLDPLTEQLQKGTVFDLPRTILFNSPQNTGERIYGLLMRSLLTLNKARQF